MEERSSCKLVSKRNMEALRKLIGQRYEVQYALNTMKWALFHQKRGQIFLHEWWDLSPHSNALKDIKRL